MKQFSNLLQASKKIAMTSVAVTALAWGGFANAAALNLALLLDGSGSIDSTEWQQQLDGYKNAFASGTFYDDVIDPSPFDTLNVRAWQFGTNVVSETAWTPITDNASATAFGNLFTFNQDLGWTNTEGAVLAATSALLSDAIVSGPLVIDISTDGNPTVCDGGTSSSSNGCGGGENPESAAIAAANDARDMGIKINALGIGNGIDISFLEALVGENPVDTPTGFYLTATFDNFGDTLITKLGREINPTPEPGTLALIGISLLGFGLARRRQKA